MTTWRIRWTRPNGDTGVSVSVFDDQTEAKHWADLARKHCREGCTYDVIPNEEAR